jgi:hypothetical protein
MEWTIWTDPDGVHIWEGWGAQPHMAGQWSGSLAAVAPTVGLPLQVTVSQPDGSYDVRFLGHTDFMNTTGWGIDPASGIIGVRAAGASLLGGQIWPAELTSSIEHAVPIMLDARQLKRGFVPPAVSEDNDNSYSGSIPMGSHFALPPGIDLATVINPYSGLPLTPEGKALAKAYQKYGGYVVDTATGTISLAFAPDATDPQTVNMETDGDWIRDNIVRVLPR